MWLSTVNPWLPRYSYNYRMVATIHSGVIWSVCGHRHNRTLFKVPNIGFPKILNFWEEDNLSTKDTIAGFVLSPMCYLSRGLLYIHIKGATLPTCHPLHLSYPTALILTAELCGSRLPDGCRWWYCSWVTHVQHYPCPASGVLLFWSSADVPAHNPLRCCKSEAPGAATVCSHKAPLPDGMQLSGWCHYLQSHTWGQPCAHAKV